MQLPATAQSNLLRAAIIFLGIALVVALYSFGLGKEMNFASLHSRAGQAMALYEQAPMKVIGLYFIASIFFISLFIPVSTVLKIAAGMVFGQWQGGLIAAISNTSASLLAFLVARFLFAQWIRQSHWPILRAVRQELDKDGPWYLISMRLAPGIPLPVLNVAMGISQVKPVTFLWLSFLGVLPSSILYARIGANLIRFHSDRPESSLNIVVSLALLAAMPLAWRKFRTRSGARQNPS